MTNISTHSKDLRSVLRIIYEKAAFGAVPTHFQMDAPVEHLHDTWFPVQFVENPLLSAVQFSDGTVIQVTPNRVNTWADAEADLAQAVTEGLTADAWRESERELSDQYLRSDPVDTDEDPIPGADSAANEPLPPAPPIDPAIISGLSALGFTSTLDDEANKPAQPGNSPI